MAITVIQNGFGLLLALGVNTIIKSRNVLRVFLFAPAVVTPIVTAYLWRNLLGPDGAVNSLLGAVGLESWQQDWLGDPQLALWSIVGVIVWQFAGYSMVIFLAGLQSVPKEIYEAAAIDGAGPVRRFWSVIRPLLAPAFTINLMLSIIGGIKLFDQVYALTGGGPGHATDTISTLIYKDAFTLGEFGYSIALAVVLTIIVAGRLHRAVHRAVPQREGRVMNRYRWRTFGLELVMIAVALVVGFPVYVLVNLAVRAPSDTSSPIRPTTSPTLDNFTGAWQQGGARRRADQQRAGDGRQRPASCWPSRRWPPTRWPASPRAGRAAMFLLIMLGLVLPFQLAALPLYQTMRDLGLLGTAWALILFYSGLQVPFTDVPLHRVPAGAAARLRGRRAHRRLHPAARPSGTWCSRCSSRSR